MTVSDILDELPRLDSADRLRVLHCLIDMDDPVSDEARAEELAAIDEGIRSMRTGPAVPLEELRKRLDKWTTP